MASLDFPTDIQPKLQEFHERIKDIESKLTPLLNVPPADFKEKIAPIDKATLDIITAYSLNSLFWMYLITKGQNPKEHPVKKELDRIKSEIMKLKGIKDKVKQPKLNPDAAKRFVRNALWEPKEGTQDESKEANCSNNEELGVKDESQKQKSHSRGRQNRKRKR